MLKLPYFTVFIEQPFALPVDFRSPGPMLDFFLQPAYSDDLQDRQTAADKQCVYQDTAQTCRKASVILERLFGDCHESLED